MADQVFVQHRFTVDAANGYPPFSDAITLPVADYQALTSDQIAQQKASRYAAWTAALDAAAKAPAPTADQEVWSLTHDLELLSETLSAVVDRLTTLGAPVDPSLASAVATVGAGAVSLAATPLTLNAAPVGAQPS